MRMLNKFAQKYWDFCKRILIPFLLFLIIYVIIHEYIHYFTLLFYGINATINWISLIPTTNFAPNISIYIKLITSIAPYFFSLILIISLFLFRKNIYVKILSTVAFVDISYNLLMLPIALYISRANDFIIIYYLGGLWLVIIFWIIALIFWILTVFEEKIKI